MLAFSSFIRLIFSLTSTALLIIKLCLCRKNHGFVAWEQQHKQERSPRVTSPPRPVFSFRQLWSEFPVCIGVWRMVAAHFPRLRNITHVMSVLHACLALSSHCQWLLIPLNHAMDRLEIEMRRITWMNISRCACKHLSKLFVPLGNSRPAVIPVINSFPHSLFAAYCFPFLFHSSPISVWTFITESL